MALETVFRSTLYVHACRRSAWTMSYVGAITIRIKCGCYVTAVLKVNTPSIPYTDTAIMHITY